MDIAIIDDEAPRRDRLAALLGSAGHRLLSFDGIDALPAVHSAGAPDLVLLAWSGPDEAARGTLGRLRERAGAELAVIVTAEQVDERVTVAALGAGADDCVAWPPRADELLARIEALGRRMRLSLRPAIRLGGYEFDLERRTVQLDGQPVALTQKEYDLAVHFFRHPGVLLARAELLRRIWGAAAGVNSRTVDTHASRVRRKLRLDASGTGWRLTPVYGAGYRLEPVPERPQPGSAPAA